MKSKVVAILETRTGAHLAELIARRGGVPLLAPALEELPDVDPEAIASLLVQWSEQPFQVVIFQTGVGTKALFAATDEAGSSAELLDQLTRSTVVVRGPKPVGELHARGVRIDLRAASPFTTESVLACIEALPMRDARVLLQRYGAANQQMRDVLQARGAVVHEIATYRWALPADLAPLHHLLRELRAARVDAVLFTSAVQMHHLYQVAQRAGHTESLAAELNATLIGSIGPVCSRTLREYGVIPYIEADPPKLGPLLAALEAAIG